MKTSLLITLVATSLALNVSPASAIKFNADTQDAASLNGNALSPASGKSYGQGVLKAEEVKRCVALAAKINALDREVQSQKSAVHGSVASHNQEAEALKKLDADINTQQASLNARSKALSDEKSTVDTSNKEAVAAFNAKSQALEQDKTALNGKIQELNDRLAKLKAADSGTGTVDVREYNDKVKSLNKQLDTFDDACSDKDYYADDYAAAKAALKQ